MWLLGESTAEAKAVIVYYPEVVWTQILGARDLVMQTRWQRPGNAVPVALSLRDRPITVCAVPIS